MSVYFTFFSTFINTYFIVLRQMLVATLSLTQFIIEVILV